MKQKNYVTNRKDIHVHLKYIVLHRNGIRDPKSYSAWQLKLRYTKKEIHVDLKLFRLHRKEIHAEKKRLVFFKKVLCQRKKTLSLHKNQDQCLKKSLIFAGAVSHIWVFKLWRQTPVKFTKEIYRFTKIVKSDTNWVFPIPSKFCIYPWDIHCSKNNSVVSRSSYVDLHHPKIFPWHMKLKYLFYC